MLNLNTTISKKFKKPLDIQVNRIFCMKKYRYDLNEKDELERFEVLEEFTNDEYNTHYLCLDKDGKRIIRDSYDTVVNPNIFKERFRNYIRYANNNLENSKESIEDYKQRIKNIEEKLPEYLEEIEYYKKKKKEFEDDLLKM